MKLLVAVDFSASVEHVIDYVRKLGTVLNARVWLLHATDPHPELVGHEAAPPKVRSLAAEEFHKEHRQLQQLGDELRDSGLDCVALLIQGQTVETILAEAEKLMREESVYLEGIRFRQIHDDGVIFLPCLLDELPAVRDDDLKKRVDLDHVELLGCGGEKRIELHVIETFGTGF